MIPAALSLGGLAATHNITLLCIPITLPAYIGVLWWGRRTWQALVWPVIGGMAALGVSAFFWAPLILERATSRASPSILRPRIWAKMSGR